MQRVHRLAERIAPGTLPVLILGETGSGKEVLAQRIHGLSPRAQKSFLSLNCAALTETLLESELFGHERGAFTGAVAAKVGLFETAEGGTVWYSHTPPGSRVLIPWRARGRAGYLDHPRGIAAGIADHRQLVTADTVVLAEETIPAAPARTPVERLLHWLQRQNHGRLERAYDIVSAATTESGEPIRVVRIPTPVPTNNVSTRRRRPSSAIGGSPRPKRLLSAQSGPLLAPVTRTGLAPGDPFSAALLTGRPPEPPLSFTYGPCREA